MSIAAGLGWPKPGWFAARRVATAGSLTPFHCDTESSVLTIPTQAGGPEQKILSGIGFFG